MRFWDSSALVAVLAKEPASRRVVPLLEADPGAVVWWATPVECASAAARRRREGSLRGRDLEAFLRVLEAAAAHWHLVQPAADVAETAIRLVRVHPLGAADALQLAAALAWAEGHPAGRGLVSLDARLREAAEREGFLVLPETE